MKRALTSKILKKMGNLFKSSLELVLDFYRPLSLPIESTRFCLCNSSIICQSRLRFEFRSCVLSPTIVAIAYEGEYAYWKSTIVTFNGEISFQNC